MTPQEALDQAVSHVFLSSSLRGHGKPGEIIQRFPEDSDVRQALRKLTSDDALKAVDYLAYSGIDPRSKPDRRGRYNLTLANCSVPGCTLLRPVEFGATVQDNGTCQRHAPKLSYMETRKCP